MGACHNCGSAGSRAYTLVFDPGLRLEDRQLCADCHAFFDRSGHLEVLEASAIAPSGPGVEAAEE